jgi:Fur family transcriptional regulator, iron response regulator
MSKEATHYRNQVIDRLKAAGVTPTQQRVEIAQILFRQPQHLSAEQVLSEVNVNSAMVSKATVYNTLGLFAEKGLVREVIVDPTKVFYDSNISNHHHFYNVDTGNLTDIDPASVKVETLPPLPDGTVADGVDVIIRLRQSGSN